MFVHTRTDENGVSGMAQRVKALAAQPEDQSSIPGSRKSCPLTYTRVHGRCTLGHTHEINELNVINLF